MVAADGLKLVETVAVGFGASRMRLPKLTSKKPDQIASPAARIQQSVS
jgi:hypothetical protein